MVSGQNDVERQLRAAIDATAARTGARISGADSALVAMVLGSLTPSELRILADSPDAVLGKIASIVTHFADEDLKRQGLQTKGPAAGKADDLKTGDGLHVEARRGVPKLLMADLAERASNEKGSGSSAKYADAGMTVPGNADARGFDIRNYYTSPVTRGLVDMGVTDRTYDFVRQSVPGVSTDNIRRAARDADKMGFGVNNEKMVKNHAIIRHKDKEADKTNKNLQDFGKGLDESKEFREAALALKNSETEEQRKQALARIKEISEGLAKKHGVTEDMARQRDQKVSKAIGEIKDQKAEDKVKEIHKAAPGPLVGATERQEPKLTTESDALVKAAEAKLAAKLGAPKTASAVPPEPKADAVKEAPPKAALQPAAPKQ